MKWMAFLVRNERVYDTIHLRTDYCSFLQGKCMCRNGNLLNLCSYNFNVLAQNFLGFNSRAIFRIDFGGTLILNIILLLEYFMLFTNSFVSISTIT